MDAMLTKIGEIGLIPVVKIEDAASAVSLGKALLKAELPVAEITFRTAAAEQAIKNLTSELPDLLVGAGTVLTVDQVKKAAAAGARFIVSPGLNPKVVEYCIKNSIPVTPGINSPTQIETALEYGLKVVKYFPAEASGGLSLLKAMAAPYGDIKFIPTGGINSGNLNTYLAFDKVLACGGSWMVKTDLINSNKFNEITELAIQAVRTMLGFELIHVGINEQNEAAALKSSGVFSNLFNFKPNENPGSVFLLSNSPVSIEVLKKKYLGLHGHLAIGTNNIYRAIAYLNRKGVKMNQETANQVGGKLKTIYLDTEISGFAVHLIQK